MKKKFRDEDINEEETAKEPENPETETGELPDDPEMLDMDTNVTDEYEE